MMTQDITYKINVRAVVPRVGDVSTDQERQTGQSAAERQEPIRLWGTAHGEVRDLVDESGNVQELFADLAGVASEFKAILLLFEVADIDGLRLHQAADVYGGRLLRFRLVVTAWLVHFAELSPVVAGTRVVVASKSDGTRWFLDEDG